jgi:hypothetical protein
MPHEPLIWLIRKERRALTRGQQVSPTGADGSVSPKGANRRCLYCTAKLANGSAVCSDECAGATAACALGRT